MRRAFSIVASIFSRLRMMPESASSRVDIGRPEGGDAIDVEIGKGGAKRGPLVEDRQPGKPGLIDLEDEPFEQHILVGRREAVFGIVIGPVHRMAGGEPAIGGAQLTARGS